MNDKSAYDVDTGTVNFRVALPSGGTLLARISEEALQDHFGADGTAGSLVQAYRANHAVIDAKAVAWNKANPMQPVLLKTTNF